MRLSILFLTVFSFFSSAQQSLKLQRDQMLSDDVRAAWHQGNYRAVLSLIRDFSNSEAMGEQMVFMEACASARLKTSDAEKKLTQFIALYPSAAGVNQAQYELGVYLYLTKKYPEASQQFSSVDFNILKKEDRHSGLFYWGYALFSQKKLKESRVPFDQLKLTDSVYGPAASYYSGFASYTDGDFELALNDFQRIQNQESYSQVVPFMISSCLQRLGRVEELIRYASSLDKALNIQNFDEINLLVAEALYAKAQYSNAITGYSDYLKSRRSADKGVLYRAGVANFQLNKFNEAIQYLKQVASDQDSTGVYAAYYLGISYLKTNQKPFALSAFQSSLRSKNISAKLLTECQYQEAKLLYDLGRPDDAIERMESFVIANPGNPYTAELGELLSGAYVNANHYHKAITHIESLKVRTPGTDRAYQKATLYSGFEYYNKGDLDQALKFFRKSLDYPLDEILVFEASIWYAEALSAPTKWEESFVFYEKVVSASARATSAQVLRARFGLGYARFNFKDYERSLINFREFISKAPKTDSRFQEAQIRLGDCYYISKSYQLAYDQYKRAADSGKASSDYALMQAGVMLGILNKNAEGIQLLEEMIRKYPQSVYWDEGIFQKSQLEFEASKYQQSADGYSNLITRRPTSKFVPFAYVRRAAALFNLKEYNRTAEDYIKVLKDYPGHPAAQDILLPLQEALNLASRGDEFDALLVQFKERNPGVAGIENIEFESAQNLYLNQEYSRAIAAFTNFILSYPSSIRLNEAKFLKAECWYRQRETANALSSYYEIAQDEQFISASRVQSRIAELESKSSNSEKAIEAFRKLLRLSSTPKDRFSAWGGLMDGYFLLGQYDSVLRYSEKILAENGTSSTLQHRASLMNGRVYQAMGDFEKAKDGYIMTINEAQDEYGAEAKYYLAEIYFAQKNHRQCYETILSLNRDYAPHLEWVGKGFLLLAESFVMSGETFQAKATLQSLDKFPLPVIKEEALRRLAKLELEETQRQSIKSDSTDHE